MAVSLKFYEDSSLTTEITSVTINQLADGSTGDVNKLVYLGSTVDTSTFEATSDPGVDQIEITIEDASPGSGVQASNIKLALSSGGLDSATAGDPLDVGTSIDGGVANAVPIYIRSDTPAISNSSTEITLETNDITETL
jgi:hypothetical protein